MLLLPTSSTSIFSNVRATRAVVGIVLEVLVAPTHVMHTSHKLTWSLGDNSIKPIALLNDGRRIVEQSEQPTITRKSTDYNDYLASGSFMVAESM